MYTFAIVIKTLLNTLNSRFMIQNSTQLKKKSLTFMVICGFALSLSAQSIRLTQARIQPEEKPLTAQKTGQYGLNRSLLEKAPKMKETTRQKDLKKAPDADVYDLFNEDFSRFAQGSETDMVATPRVKDSAYIDPSYTHEPHWWGAGVYQAGGVCGLFSDADPTLTGGYITSPSKDYSGEVTIRFRIKKRPGVTDTKATYLSIVSGDLLGGKTRTKVIATVQVPLTDDWVEHEYTYSVTTTESACIQLNSYTACFIDDFSATSKSTVLAKPYAYSATDFKKDGFTASWSKVRLADSYLFTAFTYAPTGKSPVQAHEGFDGINYKDGFIDKNQPGYPEGWDIHITDDGTIGNVYTGEGSSSDGKYESTAPALLIDDMKDYIAIPDNGGKITAFSFWVKMIPPRDNPNLTGKITVEGWDGISWNSLGLSAEGFDPNHFMKFDLGIFMGMYDCTCFRIVPENLPEGLAFAIDDVEYETAEPRDLEYAYLDEPVKDTKFVLTGLNPESDYTYYVKSVSPKFPGQQPLSNSVKALGISKPELKEATDITATGYTANWEPTPKAQSYEVTNYSIYTAAEDEEAHVILDEDFSKVDVPFTTDEPVEMEGAGRLDEYTQLPGWQGNNYTLAEGMLGGMGDPQYQIQGIVATPLLTLGNNGGNFEVTVDAWGHQGDILFVQCGEETQGMQFSATGIQYATLKFKKGHNDDQLIFYSYNSLPFFLDKIQVVQNLHKGDQTFTATRWAQVGGKDNTSYTFKDLETSYGNQFAFDVVALYPYTSLETYRSENSDKKIVPEATAIDNIVTGKAVNTVYTKGNNVIVELDEPSTVKIYTPAGRLVKETSGNTGRNTITLSHAGLYIVKTSTSSTKVVISR